MINDYWQIVTQSNYIVTTYSNYIPIVSVQTIVPIQSVPSIAGGVHTNQKPTLLPIRTSSYLEKHLT